ncbi:arabinofuranosyltransferase [Nocardioides piscis]|uniref:Galactan 5-O-arabinofuranosyltransferase n=1 Tax=Nocardioides piscis TaxID=2714938 RepID=A0A6G7YK14_9ACTN|nr:arabinofuranosyltransferase [Nocardioides piscis]QIK77077.1 arabinofuranosyltransferase [Nocardioides piscis]
MLLARQLDLDPMTEQGAFLPVAVLAVLVVAGGWATASWRAEEMASAVAAGVSGAWVAFALQVALTGTPFGFAGLQSDNGRTTASATKYSVSMWSSDTFVDDLPSEYPPLFPWLIGRASAVLDYPAWRLVGPAEVLLISFSLVLGYLMWRRLVGGPVALLCSIIVLPVYGVPLKPFAVAVLVVFAPWAVATFTESVRLRLHWLPAGVIGGLLVLTYHGWLTFGAFGLLLVMFAGWRRSEDRRGYLRHVLATILVALVVASPYVVPFGWALLTRDAGQAVSDLFVTPEITDSSFPFLTSGFIGTLQLIGLVGLFLVRATAQWARPLLHLVAGGYIFWLVFGVRFVLTGHTTMFFYVARLNGYLLAAAGILVLSLLLSWALDRGDLREEARGLGLVLTALVLLFGGFTYWQEWRPRPVIGPDEARNYASMAHMEPLPDCTYPKYIGALPEVPCLPVEEIRREVSTVVGKDARPHTLAGDERLFSFLPWRAYMGVDRTSAGTLVRFDDRMAELRRLTTISSQDEFSDATRDTAFGPIDVFVLGKVQDGKRWAMWDAEFNPAQFSSADWHVVDRPDWSVAVAVRRPS